MKAHTRMLCATAAIAGVMFGAPALADVKAGVDAWSAGDYAAAVREWSGPAAEGDPDAQFNMAQAYRLGRGVETDLEQAEALYARAAAQGHIKAADNYGLLLFQDGRRDQAMPYIKGAADRGDPRAQYLLGIAHFNGDFVPKDWIRAYALLTLANATGLPQASAAMAQMDQYIPLPQRQAAQSLAGQLKAEAEAARARELAAVDLAMGSPRAAQPPPAATPAPAGTEESVDANFLEQPRPVTRPAPVPAAPSSAATAPKPMTGPWKVQLGAFGVSGNADRLWARLSGRPELAGTQRVDVPSGRVTILKAGGFATRGAAQAACSALKRAGHDCLVNR